jgi:hypothetical protein
MLNDFYSDEEARDRIKQNIKDAETDNLLRRMGYNNHGMVRWFVVLVVLGIAVGLLL